MDDQLLRDLQVLWDYMRLGMTVRPADCIVGFGCYDEDIPCRAAQLYREGYAPLVLFSGGLGRNTSKRWTITEAERFAAIAEAEGVPRNAILLENASSNSGENLLFTRKMLTERGINRIIAIHKPYMERRLFAAMGVYWPEVEAVYTSPQVSIAEHIRHGERAGMTEREIVETIVGDIQRMEVYAKRGYQIYQPIPAPVRQAYSRLVERGYTGQLIRE